MTKSTLLDDFPEYRPLTETGYAPVLVALSGGADSAALFHLTADLCRKNGGYFYACHVNHGIRGDEALRDRDFCITMANDSLYCRNIFVLNADIPAMCRESGRSLELEARLCRYEFFEKVMKENQISTLVTAHNADDNLETLIFNLVRGSGVKGMCGIPPKRELSDGRQVLRPLLFAEKSEILSFCRENGIPYVTDSTNLDSDYSRNLIRNKVIPLLEGINPALRQSAARLSESMREVTEHMEGEAIELIEEKGLELSVVKNTSRALLPFIFSKAMTDAGFDTKLEQIHIKALSELCQRGREGSSISLPDSLSGVIRSGRLCFTAERPDNADQISYELTLIEGENLLPDGSTLILKKSSAVDNDGISIGLRLEGDLKLTARERREGDKIRLKGINKSLKKLMCDMKIPVHMRSRLPVILADGRIVAVIGVAVSDECFSKNDINTVLTLKTANDNL